MAMIKIERSHKMWLEVTVIGESTLKIKLLMVASGIPKQTYEKSSSYVDKGTGLVVWSFQDFIFDDRQLRIPQTNMLSDKMEHTHDFKSENARYKYLKKLYKTLNNWASDVHIFPTTFSYRKKNSVDLNERYWVIN